MERIVHRQRGELGIELQPDRWTRVQAPGDPIGIALDPVVSAIWSRAEDHDPAQIAETVQVSTHLALCTLAILEHAGLLQGRPGSKIRPTTGIDHVPSMRISALILHHQPRASLDTCLASLMAQKQLPALEPVIVAAAPTGPIASSVQVIDREGTSAGLALAETLDEMTGDAILILDSRVELAPGSLTELMRILDLREDIAAVAPRMMWKQWPSFVAHIGDWRTLADDAISPYTGYLDVGQFERPWQSTPAIHFETALIRRASLQRAGMPPESQDLDMLGIQWSHRARQRGYNVLAALQALAFGPWSHTGGQDPRPDEALTDEKGQPHPLVHERAPALTVEGIRTLYSHYPAISPEPIRRRIGFVMEETARWQTLAAHVNGECQAIRIEPDVNEESLLYERCRTADMIVTATDYLERFELLQRWDRPILLDAPRATDIKSVQALLPAVDGIVCVSQRESQHWLQGLWAEQQQAGGDPFVDDPVQMIPVHCRHKAIEPGALSPAVTSLLHFCQRPCMATEREVDVYLGPDRVPPPPPPPTPILALPGKARQILTQKGVGATIQEVFRYFRWKVGL